MGTMHFALPPDLTGPAFDELKKACITGGQDNMPFLTQVAIAPGQLRVGCHEEESGCVEVPWIVDRAGELMTSTATLIEKASPYPLALELARGKVNRLRNQAAEWQLSGLSTPASLPQAIHQATMSLGRAIACSPSVESTQHSRTAIAQAYEASDQLVKLFVQQVFQIRHQRQPRLDTTLACGLGTAIPAAPVGAALREAVNTVCLPLTWATVQPTENEYRFEVHDQLFEWSIANGFHVTGGPLIDCNKASLPPWLTQRPMSLAGIATSACAFVAALVKHYKGRIGVWELAAGLNAGALLNLSEDEVLWLMLRLAEAARQADSTAELQIGLAQPWGEYLASQPRRLSPFVFADTLIRSGVNLSSLNLEMVMGVWPRGTYCRDLLEASRLIDLYSLLGVPLQVTLGLPSDPGRDVQASPELAVSAGCWRDGFTPQTQAEWAAAFVELALCKPTLRSVAWIHLDDAEPHLFPGCGLVNAQGAVKPAMAALAKLRAAHLR